MYQNTLMTDELISLSSLIRDISIIVLKYLKYKAVKENKDFLDCSSKVTTWDHGSIDFKIVSTIDITFPGYFAAYM